MKLSGYLLLLIFIFTFVFCKADNINHEDDYDDNQDEDDQESESIPINDFSIDFFKEDNGYLNLNDVYTSWNIDLCKAVKCKRNQRCVVKSKVIAVCVDSVTSKSLKVEKKLHKVALYKDLSNSEFQKLEKCKSCPYSKPEFYCGTDNLTYSSLCRLDLHNCVHAKNVEPLCKGFCPCNQPASYEMKLKMIRLNQAWNKYKSKLDQLNKKRKYHKYLKSKNETLYSNSNISQKKKFVKNDNYLTQKYKSKSCNKQDLRIMGSRLLDWFSVVYSILKQSNKDLKKNTLSSYSFPDCTVEVVNMFYHLDTDEDMRLSLKELFDLEHNQKETCLKQYLDSCDEDHDTFLNPYEWCSCFDHKSKPCSQEYSRRKHLVGGYIPRCDEEGFYKPLQCHGSIGQCWCVDKYGVEFLNSRHKGKIECEKFDDYSIDEFTKQKESLEEENMETSKKIETDDEDGDDDIIDDREASGYEKFNQN